MYKTFLLRLICLFLNWWYTLLGVPFLFINYNGANFNTNIYLETISELFENDVDLKELTELLISYF